MSPIYEFYCNECRSTDEVYRSQMGDYTTPHCTICDGPTEYVISVPNMHVWEAGRYFPNVTKHGDGSMSFGSKADYEKHLKKQHMGEASTDAPKKQKLGRRVIARYP